MFLTCDGDFSDQMKAKARTRFIMGCFQGGRVYQTMVEAGLDALKNDIGAIKLYDGGKGKICYERVFPDELFVDDRAASKGKPREMFQRKYIPTDVLCSKWPDHADEIRAAVSKMPSASTTYAEPTIQGIVDDQVEVIEAWHLPSGDGAGDGRHCIVVAECALLDEEWTDDCFPFAFLRWCSIQGSFFGQGLAEQLYPIQKEIRILIQRIKTAHDLLGIPWVVRGPGATFKKGGITNKIGEIIDCPSGPPPEVKVHAVLAPEVYQHLDYLYNKAFAISGISELSATSRKPAGVESGVALRTLLDTETQRFALFVDAWQEFALDLARQTLHLARRMGNARTQWRQKEWAREIKWADVAEETESDKFVLQLWPVNLLPDTPAGKLAYVEQMITMGLISPDQGQSLLDFPDLEAFQRTNSAGRDIVEEIVEHMLTTGEFIAPTKYMPLMNPDGSPGVGIQIVQGSMLRGQINGWPEDKLALLQEWLEAAEAIVAPPAPAPAAPAPGVGMPPGPMVMPPGAHPMAGGPAPGGAPLGGGAPPMMQPPGMPPA
jgi:hypothetical protein